MPGPFTSRGDRLAAALLAVPLALLWFILCRQLANEWSANEQYSYGWFVPFFALFLFWLRWEDRPGKVEFEIRNWKFRRQGPRSAFRVPRSSPFLLSAFSFLLLSSSFSRSASSKSAIPTGAR